MNKIDKGLKNVLIVVLTIALLFLFYRLILFVDPLRQVGFSAWCARGLALLGWATCATITGSCLLVPKLRKQIFKDFRQLHFRKQITSLFGWLILLLIGLGALYMTGKHAVNLGKDAYYGPVVKQVQSFTVNDESTCVRIGRHISSKVHYKKVTVHAKNGEDIELLFRPEEWAEQGYKLFHDKQMVYYQYSKIWQPWSKG